MVPLICCGSRLSTFIRRSAGLTGVLSSFTRRELDRNAVDLHYGQDRKGEAMEAARPRHQQLGPGPDGQRSTTARQWPGNWENRPNWRASWHQIAKWRNNL
jgi:hypothetical protein